MSPYKNRTPWVVLLLLVSAALLGVLAVVVGNLTRSEPVAPGAPIAAEPAPASKPQRPAPPHRTRKGKPARVANAHTQVAAPVPSPAEAVAPVVAAAERTPGPAPAPERAPAAEAAPVAEPFSAPPLLRTEAPPPAPAPEPEPAPAVVALEPEEAPLTFDGNGEAIARAIANAKRRAVQACFEHELKRAPTLHGTVNVELDLAPPQRVNDVRVTDDLESPELTRCIETTMRHLNFVGLNEEVTIHVPYMLSTRSK
jgi:hypothetical protein